MWNAIAYFENLAKTLKLTKDDYHFCKVTGQNYLEGILNSPSESKFFAVNDVDEGVTIRGNSGGYLNRRQVIVYILQKFDIKNLDDREIKLNETRLIMRKLQAKIIKDSNNIAEMAFVNKLRIPYKELPGYFVYGTCGVYFFLTLDEPVELISNDDDFITL